MTSGNVGTAYARRIRDVKHARIARWRIAKTVHNRQLEIAAPIYPRINRPLAICDVGYAFEYHAVV